MVLKSNRGKQWLNWQRRLVVVAHVAGMGACVWLFVTLFFGEMGLLRYVAMRNYSGQLESDLSALRNETASLREDIARLQHDPAKIEQLAREQLGYVRKGETVYQLNDDAADTRERRSKP